MSISFTLARTFSWRSRSRYGYARASAYSVSVGSTKNRYASVGCFPDGKTSGRHAVETKSRTCRPRSARSASPSAPTAAPASRASQRIRSRSASVTCASPAAASSASGCIRVPGTLPGSPSSTPFSRAVPSMSQSHGISRTFRHSAAVSVAAGGGVSFPAVPPACMR